MLKKFFLFTATIFLLINLWGLSFAQSAPAGEGAPPALMQVAPQDGPDVKTPIPTPPPTVAPLNSGAGNLVPAPRLLLPPDQSGHGGVPLRVGVYARPPFVVLSEDGVFRGMTIELWEEVARSLGLNFKYIPYHSFKELLADTVRGKVDVLATSFSVTLERAEVMDISYPWFDAGIRLMVNMENKGSVFEELKDTGRLYAYTWLALLMFALTLGITLLRRHFDKQFTREWRTGLSVSFHDLVVAAKSGQIPHKYFGWLGYILSAFWMIVGVAVIAYVTSTLTSAMTSVSLTSDIHSLYDLPGKKVGALSGSVTLDLLRSIGIDVKLYDEIEDAINDLHKRKLDAVVDDAPVLEYYVHTHPEKGMDVVGNLFSPDKYAFAVNKSKSKLVNAISLELIGLHENGELQRIKEKYFGPEDY